MKDGTPASRGSMGWFCLCCNYRIRQKPRSRIYKKKFHNSQNFSNNIPKYHQIMLPLLQFSSQKHHTRKELEDAIANKFNLTKQERHLVLRKKETYLTNRTNWAILYLRKANLLDKKDGFYYATMNGKEILFQNPPKIDKAFLLNIPAFHKWINKSNKKDESKDNENKIEDLITKSLDLIKLGDVYLSDLVRTLNISDDTKEILTVKLCNVKGVMKEDILYDGKILETLLRYSWDSHKENEFTAALSHPLKSQKILQKPSEKIKDHERR